MTGFAALQDALQRAIVAGDQDVMAELLDGARERRDVLLGVYRDAYALRLIEALGNDFPLLLAHLGEEAFEAMAQAYLAAHPSTHPNLRWFGSNLPAFLAAHAPYRARPVLAEIAAIETALADAFDAPDAADLAVADLAGLAPERWADLVLLPQAHVRRLDLASNAYAIWSALRDEEMPPTESTLPEGQRLLVWRQELTPMVRPVSAEEAMLWDEASAGLPFGVLCEMAATHADPDGAAARVAGYLQGWIAAGLLARFEPSDRRRETDLDGS